MPVITRRQSRGHLHPDATNESESVRYEDKLSSVHGDEEREDESGSGVSGEESDYEESDNADLDDDLEVTLPMAKRRKLEKAVPPGKASSSRSPVKSKRTGVSRRVQGRLQNMLSLPFDVLFLILSELGPMDLLNLARTNKDLQQFLMSRKSILVWVYARRNAGATTVPDPPEDMSEPAWALLLFGPAVCSECSRRNIHRIDFALRRRLCAACRKGNLFPAIKLRTVCPGLEESVIDLLPYTKVGGWVHGHFSNSRFYWKQDLDKIRETLTKLENDVDSGKPGAQQRLKSFRAERILKVDAIVQSCSDFEKWAKAEAEAQARNARERITQRHEALRARILAAGYDSVDIDTIGIVALPCANVDKVLTEHAWKRMRNKIEDMLNGVRMARILAERCQRERDHRIKAEQCYSDILRQVLPMQRLYLPALSQFCELSCFRDLLNPDRVVQPVEWEAAAGRLPDSLSEWMSEHRDRCAALLPFQVYEAQGRAMEIKLLSDPSIDHWRREAMRDFAGDLELASSVFRHPATNTILIGRDACHAWKMKGELEVFERGVEATRALLRVLQLDPATTTVFMLEQLNRQLICESCPKDLAWRRHSWRSSVLHFIDTSQTDRPHSDWRVVNANEAVLRSECPGYDVLYPPRSEAWLCNHCSNDLAPMPTPSAPFGRVSWAVSKADVIRHLQAAHNIDDPTVDVDLFSYLMFRVD